MRTMFGGTPGIISVRIYIDEKNCVVIEHIVHHLFWAVLIYPNMAIHFFIVFFPLYTFKPSFELFSIFSFSFTLLQNYYLNFDRFWCQEEQILYTSTKNTFKKLHSKKLHSKSIQTFKKFPRKTLAQMTLTQMNICLNVHLPQITFPRKLFSKIFTSQSSHLAEIKFS